MQTKLTLRLDDQLIKQAKQIARKRGKSLSQMVAEYFAVLSDKPGDNGSDRDLPLIVQSLKGALKGHELSEEDYHRYLEEKYR